MSFGTTADYNGTSDIAHYSKKNFLQTLPF